MTTPTPYIPPSAFYVPVEDDPCPSCSYELGVMTCVQTSEDHDLWQCPECGDEWLIILTYTCDS